MDSKDSTCGQCQFIDYTRPPVAGKRICKLRSKKLRESGAGGSIRVGIGDHICERFMLRRAAIA